MLGVTTMEQKERKIVKVGNSIGVSIPPEMLKVLDLHVGDGVKVTMKDDEIIMKKMPEKVELPSGIDAEFIKDVEEICNEFDQMFKNLVNR